jgi:hypothetical protein
MTSPHTTSTNWQRGAAIIALGWVAGCAHPAASFDAVTPATRDATYACVARQMTRLNYEVSIADFQKGITVGDRAGGQHGLGAMGHVDHDRLTATVFPADSTSVRLNIVANTVRITKFLKDSQYQSVKTSDAVQGDAATVMRNCAGSNR